MVKLQVSLKNFDIKFANIFFNFFSLQKFQNVFEPLRNKHLSFNNILSVFPISIINRNG